MKDVIEWVVELKRFSPFIFWASISLVVLVIFEIILITIIIRFNNRNKEIKVVIDNEKGEDDNEGKEIKPKYGESNGPNIIDSKPFQREDENKPEEKEIIIETGQEPVVKTSEGEIKEKGSQSDNSKHIEKEPIIEITYEPPLEEEDVLPQALDTNIEQTAEIIKVNYQPSINESTDNYPIFRTPQWGCVVRTHRLGNTKRRGFKEEVFEKAISRHFGNKYLVSGNVRLNTGKETRPFEPDIAIIDEKSGKNLRIDIEIDEPYAGITRQPTHCKGEDYLRDTYFCDRGWIVIRFSEYQVHIHEMECLKYITYVIESIDSEFLLPEGLLPPLELETESLWDTLQAQKWEKERYREKYLNHEFGKVPEISETVERDLNEQELSEEKLVEPSIIGVLEDGNAIGFNELNFHQRDNRIKFYPEPHAYTIDNVPAKSVSSIISKFFPEFDVIYWSTRKSYELGMTPEEVAGMWKEKGEQAAKDGKYLHEQIENYYLDQTIERIEEFRLFEDFVIDHSGLVPYRSEWRIFDEEFNVAGTVDLIARNGSGFEIYDWKRSKKVVNVFDGGPITVNQWQCGLGELKDIPDTSFNRYCLQQSLYRYILEKRYNVNVSKMYLVVLYPEYKKYYKIETPYLMDKVKHILEAL